MRRCSLRSVCSLSLSARMDPIFELLVPKSRASRCWVFMRLSISLWSVFCSSSWRDSSFCSSICTCSVISCTSRFLCSDVLLPSRSSCEVGSSPSPASPAAPAVPPSASRAAVERESTLPFELPGLFGTMPIPDRALLPPAAEPLPSPVLLAASDARLAIRQRYFCRCDLMFALVRPSTLMSLRIVLGLAMSRPSAFTAASKRWWSSGVHTNRRFWAGSDGGVGDWRPCARPAPPTCPPMLPCMVNCPPPIGGPPPCAGPRERSMP
mmetsp:Transcript_36298/g.95704  ORF Transcript_36298/g.95704 Transcript_36298/m.95704 type:complete len:266 (-) Transcript_36298:655-1452(-)